MATTDTLAVLVIDQDQPAVQAIACYLTSEGLRVSSTGDAAAGQVEVVAGHYDCILLGIAKASDAVRLTRALRETTNVPLVIILSLRDLGERIGALEAGADDCITVPFSQRELLGRIKAVVRRGRLGR